MSLGDTVAGLAAILDAEGYMADVDKLPGDSYRLTLHSCAIWAVASHYGLACTTELEFMQGVLPEAEVTRIVHKVAGAYVCAYEIRPRGTTPPTSHPKARRDLTSA
jgi:predicted ArsR family transcriptional regulator